MYNILFMCIKEDVYICLYRHRKYINVYLKKDEWQLSLKNRMAGMGGWRGRKNLKEREVVYLFPFHYFITWICHSNNNLLENITTYWEHWYCYSSSCRLKLSFHKNLEHGLTMPKDTVMHVSGMTNYLL